MIPFPCYTGWGLFCPILSAMAPSRKQHHRGQRLYLYTGWKQNPESQTSSPVKIGRRSLASKGNS